MLLRFLCFCSFSFVLCFDAFSINSKTFTEKDFFSLVSKILTSPKVNIAVDCYTKKPVDKMTLLQKMSEKFPLSYHVEYSHDVISATGQKMNYFSRNRTAERFGYKPLYSSLDGLLLEASKALKNF